MDKADDLERIVHDKRKNKRASKRKEYAVIEDIKINFLVFWVEIFSKKLIKIHLKSHRIFDGFLV